VKLKRNVVIDGKSHVLEPFETVSIDLSIFLFGSEIIISVPGFDVSYFDGNGIFLEFNLNVFDY